MSSQGTEQQAELHKQFAEVFAHLPEQDIEQFYAHYQLWLLRRREPVIEKQLELLHEYLQENQQLIESLRPSAVALAVLARLQSSGVTDIDVLDQMLERGEDWLDRMMQRLDYCEQVEDFIQGDYTQWCIRSLEGAYDWIDTVLGLGSPTGETEVSYTNVPDVNALEATEELLLQKLRLEDEESPLEITLNQPAVASKDEDEVATSEVSDASTTVQPTVVPEAGEIHIPEPQPVTYDAMEVGIAEEFLLVRESATETLENEIEGAEALELVEWENLESAEARPEPWYSVNLAADASSDAQPDTMHDWINFLQAAGVPEAAQTVEESVAAPTESNVSESSQVSEETLVTPAERSEDASQTESAEIAEVEASEEEVIAQTDEGGTGETPHLIEAQSELVMGVEDEVQSQPEMSAEDEVISEVEEVQNEPEMSAAEEVTSVVAGGESEHIFVEVEADEVGQVPELKPRSEEDAVVLEEVASTTESADEPSPILFTDDAETVSSDEDEVAELLSDEDEVAELLSDEDEVAELLSVEHEEREATEANADSDAVAEVPEEARFVNSTEPAAREASQSVDEAASRLIGVEISDEATVNEGAAAVLDMAEMSEDEAAVSSEANMNGEVSFARATNPPEIDDTVSWSYVPFEGTLSGEESSNVRPWYEYLAQDEQVAQMPQNWSGIEQSGAAEELQSTMPFKLAELTPETPALPEVVATEQHEIVEAALVEEVSELHEPAEPEQSEIAGAVVAEAVEEEPGEVAEAGLLTDVQQESDASIPSLATSTLQAELERLEQGRATNQASYPEIDATQPMIALKGKDRKKKALPVEPEVPANEVKEDPRAAVDEPGVLNEGNAAPGAANEAGEGPAANQGMPASGEQGEIPVALLREEMPSSEEQPPVKIGFWRRLFGRKARKK